VFEGCREQIKKTKNGEMRKNTVVLPREISYTGMVNFKFAAKIATPGVVNIKTTFKPQSRQFQKQEGDDFYNMPDPFKDLFKNDPFFKYFKFQFPESPQSHSQPMVAGGSGVILSSDGYIVTNNHMVSEADDINVTLYDGHAYNAKLIGADPQTDLALLKIDEKNLSFIQFGESDSIEVGEWVLAVGNPFNLASTVTAGIVSAKARNINILQDQGAIESFIQTDAAVNPGNSGGALVTLNGKLVGINTAIATPTGVYAGYAFAIPADIVKKVVNDLMNYGVVKRGFLGVVFRDLNSDLSKELKINRANGVYVDSVTENGAAKEAGMKAKDVIISIDDEEIVNAAKLQEMIALKRPGDKVKIGLIRNGNEKKELIATLKNVPGSTKVANDERSEVLKNLGVELAEISKEDQKNYNVKNGVKVIKLNAGILKTYTNMREGFLIISVNKKPVNSVESFIEIIKSQQGGGIMLEGKYTGDPATYYYAFGY
jgi:Do/DeqQ family serine protease